VFPIEYKIPVKDIENKIKNLFETYISNAAPEDNVEYLEDLKTCILEFNTHIQNQEDCPKNIDYEEYLEKLESIVNTYGNQGTLLSTIHSYKGCENDNIWILEYNKLPLISVNSQPWQTAQEYNLWFVALTRSRENLYLID
jgi:superfamily I DNA/RNA helicase